MNSVPEAVVVASHFPLPITSGGRKRMTRLLEAIERAGCAIRILTLDDIPAGIEEATARGWRVELFPRPRATVGNRFQQHRYLDPLPPSAVMSTRLAQLAGTCAFVQLEEIGSAQYFRVVRGRAPTIASLYNVDSQVARMALRQQGSPDPRGMYHWARMAYTERRVARACTAVLCVSDRDRTYFAGRHANEALMVPNGVDDELLQVALGHGEPDRVLFFGTFGWQPNDDGVRRFIVESWPLIRAQRPDARLRVAGGGAMAAVGDLAAVPGVEVVGFVDDLVLEICAARVVIAPLWVGGGTRIKVLEAMAAGRPVVGTSVGVEQIGFVDGRDGLIADTGAGLAEATLRVLDDDGLAAALGSSGRRLAEGFRWTRMTEAAEGLYRKLLPRNPDQTSRSTLER